MVLRDDERYLNPRYSGGGHEVGCASLLRTARAKHSAWKLAAFAAWLDNLLLLHGDISYHITSSSLSLAKINDTVHSNLNVPFDGKPAKGSTVALVMGSSGQLWYRGYFELEGKPAAASTADVDSSLGRFNLAHILVGHTIVYHVTPFYGGKVIAVQVYPRRDEKTGAPILEGALRLQRKWYRATAKGVRVPLFPRD